jgi:hypothetical protein
MPPRAPSGRAKEPRRTTGAPAGRSRKVDIPIRKQDGTDLSTSIVLGIATTQVQPLEARVGALEDAVDALTSLAIHTADLELRAGGRSGVVWSAGRFDDADIGAPVVMTQMATAGGDEAEAGIVQFVARIVDRRRMRVMWSCAFPVPRKVAVTYQILRGDVAGRLSALWAAQEAGVFLAGPLAGADGAATFRQIAVSDLPTGLGTVTSVGLVLPPQFSIGGSPVTSTGTLAATWISQAPNLIFSGPAAGAAAVPTFRALVEDDIPSLSWGKVSKVGSNLTDLATRQHAGLTDVTSDQHHAQVHALVGADHSAAGLTAGHFLKALTPTTFGFAVHGLTFADVGAAAAAHGHAWADVSKVGSSIADLASHASTDLSDTADLARLSASNTFLANQQITVAGSTWLWLKTTTNNIVQAALQRDEGGGSYNLTWNLYVPASSTDFRIQGGGSDWLVLTATGTLAWGGGTAISSSTNVPRLDAANAFTNVGVNSFVGALLSPTIYGSSAANGDITIEGTSSGTKTTSYVILQSTGGFVGIGTTLPATTLELVAIAAGGGLRISGAGAFSPQVTFYDTDAVAPAGSVGAAFANDHGLTGTVDGDLWFKNNRAYSLVFGTTNLERFRISDTGLVTISVLGAFAAGDKYLICDALGNVHVSATGPAS